MLLVLAAAVRSADDCNMAVGWGRAILDSPEYRVTAERVEITPLPEWIHSDIRAEVFRDPTLDGPLSIMDDDLAERIYRAFARHPWVAKVIRVNKQQPQGGTGLPPPGVHGRGARRTAAGGRARGLLPPGISRPPRPGYPRLTGVEQRADVAGRGAAGPTPR